MSPDAADADASGGAAPLDPFADLLFTLIAAVLPAILILIPAMHVSATAPGPAAAPAVTVEGIPAAPIIAGADGLRLTGANARRVPLDAVPDDPGLRAALSALRERGEPLLLIVEPDGLESAFLLEPVAAAFGPARMQQVRAREACGATRDPALRAACAGG